PNSTAFVQSLVVSGSMVYAGGDFTTVGGQTRWMIAALDATVNTNNATAWNPEADFSVYALAVSGSTVYVGGLFTTVGGQVRNRIAALNATVNTNNATAWNPYANFTVSALAVSGSTVYAGGEFTTIGGQTRNRIAALNATTGNATAWDPIANGTVRALAVSGSTVYAGGEFTTIGGNGRNRFAAFGIPFLSNLAPSSGALSPTFAWNTTAYSDNVANSVGSITVTPTTPDATAVIRVNGVVVASGAASGAIPLVVGANTITITITSWDGIVTTYTLTVTRAAANNDGTTAPKEVPEADTLLLLGGGMSGLGVWLRWQWSKRRKK
ncbi:MAG: cadherin-like beta sandwich domain-containing protein, partial [Chloroflexota bacterium]